MNGRQILCDSKKARRKQVERNFGHIYLVFVPTIENGEEHWIRVFSFFFHAKSATTNNHVTGLSAGADLGISLGGFRNFFKGRPNWFSELSQTTIQTLIFERKGLFRSFLASFDQKSAFFKRAPPSQNYYRLEPLEKL